MQTASRKRPSSAVSTAVKKKKTGPLSSKKKAYAIKTSVTIGDGFPKMVKTKLHYCDNFILTAIASGTTGTQQFIINGLYDFDFTGTGHQPYYFDQYMAIYDHYHVIGAKITVDFINTSTTPIVVGGYINDDTAVSVGTLSAFQEQPFSKYAVLPPASACLTTTLSWNWSAAQFFTGRKETILADTELQGTAAANPIENSVLCLYYRNTDITLPTSVSYTVKAEFIACFHELKDVTQS